jgi:hypothetical protein
MLEGFSSDKDNVQKAFEYGLIASWIFTACVFLYIIFNLVVYKREMALPLWLTSLYWVKQLILFFMVISIFFADIKLFKAIFWCLYDIFYVFPFIFNPLLEPQTRQTYNGIRYRKFKWIYYWFSVVWFVLRVLFDIALTVCYTLAIVFISFFMGQLMKSIKDWSIMKD